jgi:hypothetical protein
VLVTGIISCQASSHSAFDEVRIGVANRDITIDLTLRKVVRRGFLNIYPDQTAATYLQKLISVIGLHHFLPKVFERLFPDVRFDIPPHAGFNS